MDIGKNPWKTISSEQIYDSPWIRLREDQVLNPAGNPSTYSVTEFKKWAIGIIPIDDEGYTYLVGQWRYPFQKYTWEIPEGGGLKSDTPLASAKRELKEETGIIAHDWKLILEMDMSNSATDEHAFIFVAQNLDIFASEPDEDEELVVQKIPFSELCEKVMKGELQDSLTVTGVLKAMALGYK